MKDRELVLSIKFSEEPDVRIRGIKDDDTEPTKQDKIERPFEIFNTITVFIETTCRKFDFDIYNGYTWNGADIPRFLWRLIGSKTSNEFLQASMLHDYLLTFKKYIYKEVLKESISISEYRRLTSLIFREKIKNQGTKVIKANIMSWAVDIFQHYFNRKEWRKLKN